jgi:hypothetical protein
VNAPPEERRRPTGRALNGISIPSTSRKIKGEPARPDDTVKRYRRSIRARRADALFPARAADGVEIRAVDARSG